ncbi:alpha/beta hydrolase [Isoptericola halotolerans]|uniref:Pimeloyl-ACP methyl ester carboxylesterase n=1 Tax=Isoptericola halotolerans TaxID=300560 RepID=A0ABX2A5R4_9MICO|nr:alpha/beta hydrolase [Isoptericola halotolerans]NOV98055.1 pimeloyl-ACP methyl ester carboxylesterase [Isoptericola halotolerans]
MAAAQAGGPQLDRRFIWRGREIAWTAFGSGPPLVFCHGTPWSSWLWAPYARALSTEFTVHLWDMPGYGASSKAPEHDVDLGTQGLAFAALLDHWALDSPHVVAHDYGGAVSLRAHLLHGRPYASLCLVDVVALRPWGSPYFSLVAEHADTFGRLPAPVHLGALEAYVAGASHRGLRPEETAALVDPWRDTAGQAAFYRQIAQADERFTAELEPLLGEITVPTHVVWGEEDTWIPADRADRLAAALGGTSVTLVPDAGHLIQLDAPVALATELHRWLTRVEAAR